MNTQTFVYKLVFALQMFLKLPKISELANVSQKHGIGLLKCFDFKIKVF